MNNRLISLDAFRGLTIAFMILVNTPGHWAYVYSPLRHAKWNGCTLTDLVFPFFLFIVGVAMRFSFEKFESYSLREAKKTILLRALTIFVIGLLINAYPFIRQDWNWSTFRIMGVLQRIGLAYGIAGLMVLNTDLHRIIYKIVVILVGYWGMFLLSGWWTNSPPFDLETNLVRRIDLLILGQSHLWQGMGIPFEPEGLLSTIPSISTILLGFIVGTMIRTASDIEENAKRMAVLGAGLIILGWIWSGVFPLNKQLWTSSYVLFTGGIASLILSCFYWIIDVKKIKHWAFPLVIFGTNSIFVFAASGLWIKTILKIKFSLNGQLISGYGYLYKTVFQPIAGDLNGSLLFALTHVIGWWFLLFWMYRKKIFIKL